MGPGATVPLSRRMQPTQYFSQLVSSHDQNPMCRERSFGNIFGGAWELQLKPRGWESHAPGGGSHMQLLTSNAYEIEVCAGFFHLNKRLESQGLTCVQI